MRKKSYVNFCRVIFLSNGSYCDNPIILAHLSNDKKEKSRFIEDICVGSPSESVLIVFKLISSLHFVFTVIVFHYLRENAWKTLCSSR